MAKSKGIIFHTDAVQAVGKIPMNLSKSNIDLLSISGHKLHAPKGVGVLYVRKGTRLAPFMLGGHQEGGRRAGTENVPGIIGLGKACELAAKNIDEENKRVKYLRDKLEKAISKKCPDCYGQWRYGKPAAQYDQYQLRIYRGRGDFAYAR